VLTPPYVTPGVEGSSHTFGNSFSLAPGSFQIEKWGLENFLIFFIFSAHGQKKKWNKKFLIGLDQKKKKAGEIQLTETECRHHHRRFFVCLFVCLLPNENVAIVFPCLRWWRAEDIVELREWPRSLLAFAREMLIRLTAHRPMESAKRLL